MREFKKSQNGTNMIMDRRDWYVSYNASPGAGISFFESDGGESETALCIGESFYILNGDFRKEYMDCETLGDAKNVYRNNIERKSSWSDELPE